MSGAPVPSVLLLRGAAEPSMDVRASLGTIGMLEAGRRVPSAAMAEALIAGYRLSGDDARLLRREAVPGVGRDHRGPTS